MTPNRNLEAIGWAAHVVPQSSRLVQDAYDELLWAVLRGEHDQAAALQEAIAGLLREYEHAPAA